MFVFSNYSFVFLVASAICALFIALLFPHRKRRAAGFLFSYQIAAFMWNFIYIFESAATESWIKELLSAISYPAIFAIPQFFLLMVFALTEKGRDLRSPKSRWIWYLLPIIAFGVAITNRFHNLLWLGVPIQADGLGIYLHGPLFWPLAVASYAMIAMGIITLWTSSSGKDKVYKRQFGSIILAALFPFITNILYVARVGINPGFDITPLGFLLTGIAVFIATSRFHLLDIIPTAARTIVNALPDPIFVIDGKKRIIDLNPAGLHLSQGNKESVIGREIDALVPELSGYLQEHQGEVDDAIKSNDFQLSIRIEMALTGQQFDLNVMALGHRWYESEARLVLLRERN